MAVLLTEILRRAAIRVRLVDLPDARKRHDGQMPLCGGLAIFAAFAIAALTFNSTALVAQGNLALALAILVGSGVADDRWRLPVAPRLAMHFAAALLLVLYGAPYAFHLANVPYGVVPAALFPVIVIFAATFIVGVVNATNMSDGVDGLAGGWSAAALFWLAQIAHNAGRPDMMFVALLLLAAIVGFLTFNMRHPWRPKASIFMGDAGSIGIGGAIGYFIVALSSGAHGVSFLSLLWIVVLPMTDMASLIVRRILAGRSPMSADRWHLHHLALDLGIPHGAASGLIVFASASCGAVAYFGPRLGVPDMVLAAGLLVPIALHGLFVLFAGRRIVAIAGAPRQVGEPALVITARGFEATGQ